jgi:hypothetical protein
MQLLGVVLTDDHFEEPQIYRHCQHANQIWRIEINEELVKLIKHKNIVNYIKAQRLSWFGHVQRMSDTRTVLLLLLAVGLPVANAPDVLQPCGLLYYP